MKRFLIAPCLVVVLIMLCLVVLPAAHGADQVIKLKMATFIPNTTIQSKLLQDWANEVEKRTGGRVKITIYWAGTLISLPQMYDGITKEVADIGFGILSNIKGRFPMMEVIDLPLGNKTSGNVTKLIDAYYKKFRPKELEDVKVLMLDAHGPGALNTRKPVSKLEDVKGMKIRAHNISAKIVSALGGAPVGLPITDTYDAMSKGVIDGMMLEKGGVYNWKMTDLVKYTVECPATGYSSSFFTVMNKKKWNSLPKDIQTIIDKVDQEWVEKASAMWIAWDDMGKKELEKYGVKFVSLPKSESDRWSAKTQPIIDEWIKTVKAKGLSGGEAVKFCQDWLKANQK